jgi:hypothetical protein
MGNSFKSFNHIRSVDVLVICFISYFFPSFTFLFYLGYFLSLLLQVIPVTAGVTCILQHIVKLSQQRIPDK